MGLQHAEGTVSGLRAVCLLASQESGSSTRLNVGVATVQSLSQLGQQILGFGVAIRGTRGITRLTILLVG